MKTFKKRTKRLDGMPELGTGEAAVRACENLIAHASRQPEATMRYWLELYFTVRLAYDIGEHRRRCNDEPRCTDEQLEKALQDFRRAFAPKTEETFPSDQKPSGPESEEAATKSNPTAELTETLAGFEPVTIKPGGAPKGNTNATDAKKFKRETFERLLKVREAGVSIAQIVDASNGSLSHDIVLNILNTIRTPITAYRELAFVLDRIETKTKEVSREHEQGDAGTGGLAPAT